MSRHEAKTIELTSEEREILQRALRDRMADLVTMIGWRTLWTLFYKRKYDRTEAMLKRIESL